MTSLTARCQYERGAATAQRPCLFCTASTARVLGYRRQVASSNFTLLYACDPCWEKLRKLAAWESKDVMGQFLDGIDEPLKFPALTTPGGGVAWAGEHGSGGPLEECRFCREPGTTFLAVRRAGGHAWFRLPQCGQCREDLAAYFEETRAGAGAGEGAPL